MFKMINFTSRVFYCNLIETAFICWSPCQGRGPGWTPDLAGTALCNSSSPLCEDPRAGSLPMPVVKTGRSEALNTPRHPPSSQHSPSVSATEDARARRADGRGGRGGGRASSGAAAVERGAAKAPSGRGSARVETGTRCCSFTPPAHRGGSPRRACVDRRKIHARSSRNKEQK